MSELQSTIKSSRRGNHAGPIPFPVAECKPASAAKDTDAAGRNDSSADDVLAAFATVSRRINDLARELKCLGYFEDDHDRPRAA